MLLQKGNRYRPLALLILKDKRQSSQNCLWYFSGEIKTRRKQPSKSKWDLPHWGSNINKNEDRIPHTDWSCLIKWDLFRGNEKISPSILWGLLLYSTGANPGLGICSWTHQNPTLALVWAWTISIPLGQSSPLWRDERGQKNQRMHCLFEKYAVEPNFVWTRWIDNHSGLVSRRFRLRVDSRNAPFCSRQECLCLAKHQCHG